MHIFCKHNNRRKTNSTYLRYEHTIIIILGETPQYYTPYSNDNNLCGLKKLGKCNAAQIEKDTGISFLLT